MLAPRVRRKEVRANNGRYSYFPDPDEENQYLLDWVGHNEVLGEVYWERYKRAWFVRRIGEGVDGPFPNEATAYRALLAAFGITNRSRVNRSPLAPPLLNRFIAA